ncbi:ABC transporter substrate-binding protein [Paenibacillus herberti]|uniref:ABC transporter substrate-binding protein n=2 Tax=Paenibacillus herberti TaxID=1619309 RepID=A0A229P5A7_9BACL|nr:ABC transporter substrate-binding protein [Paenibacillus herberti]
MTRITGKRARRSAALGLSLVMASGVIAGCSGSSSEQPENSVLRIGMLYGSPDSESWIRQQFTDTFEYTHPNVTLEIVYANNYNDMNYNQPPKEGEKQPDPYDKLKELMTGKNPIDVIMIDYPMLQRTTQDGFLQQLDPLIAKDKFDISDYVPTVIDGLKAAGDSKIYALTPTFNSSALFYNKKIFADAGVQPPTDKMTWNQVFDLARKVSKGKGETQTFGLQMNRWGGDAFGDIQTYIAPLELKMYDDKGEKMLVDSGPAWSNAWKTMIDLYKDKVLATQEDLNKLNEARQKKMEKDKSSFNPYQSGNDYFSSGNVAMMVSDYNFISELKRTKDMAVKNKDIKVVDWDVVTVPVFEEKPDVGGSSYLGQPMGINAKAQNPEGAWEFIKFINSREWAKLKSRSTYEIPARQEFIKPIDGMQYNIKAFYTLKPVTPPNMAMEQLGREKPGIYEVNTIGQAAFQEALTGKKTPEEAVKEWAVKGNALLQKLKTNPQGNTGGGTTDGAASGG